MICRRIGVTDLVDPADLLRIGERVVALADRVARAERCGAPVLGELRITLGGRKFVVTIELDEADETRAIPPFRPPRPFQPPNGRKRRF